MPLDPPNTCHTSEEIMVLVDDTRFALDMILVGISA
jgi:hypothetical protein